MTTLSIYHRQAGIDLGTTNSEIAVYDQNGLRVLPIKSGENDYIFKSAVYFASKKEYYAGGEALNMIKVNEEKNGYVEFKRKMGQADVFPIKSTGENLLPEELSGIILRKLKDIYKREIGDELRTVVVTIPMRFFENASSATRVSGNGCNEFLLNPNNYVNKSWKLKLNPPINPKITIAKNSPYYCDFLDVELLMEPIAAAKAYGIMNQKQDNENWLVYDLGGGTFDVAIINNFNQIPSVIASGGNDHLGGKDLDESLMDYVLDYINSNGYKIDKTVFKNDSKYHSKRTILKVELENTKIELSEKINKVRNELAAKNLPLKDIDTETLKVSVDINLKDQIIRDENGNNINLIIQLNAAIYNSIISEHIYKTLEICANLLKSKNLQAKDIQKIVLVGGPTKYYYIPWLIKEKLGIAIEQNSVDPMLAVALGAAIHAANKPIEDPDIKDEINRILKKGNDSIQLELNYRNSTNNITEFITGGITDKESIKYTSTITFTRMDSKWESEASPIYNDGTFDSELQLKANTINEFSIIIHGKNGESFTSIPNKLTIIHPAIQEEDIAPHNLNVTLFDGTCFPMIYKDEKLPASRSHGFVTASQILKSEETKTILEIEITEGESMYAGRNRVVSKLVFTNKAIPTDIPENTPVLVSIEQTGDRSILPTALLLGKSEDGKLDSTKTVYTVDTIEKFFSVFKSEKNDLNRKLTRWGRPEDVKRFELLDIELSIKKVDDLLKLFNETMETDHLAEAHNELAEAFVNIEKFDLEFVLIRIEKLLAEFNLHKKPNSKMDDNLAQWTETFKRLKNQFNNALNYNEKQTVYREALILENSLDDYDREYLFLTMVYRLVMFTETRENGFINDFADLLNMVRDKCRDYNNYTILSQLNPIVGDWNLAMKDNSRYRILSTYLSRLKYILPVTVYEIFEEMDTKDNYSLHDYEIVARYFNNLLDKKESRYDFKNCEIMAAFKPKRSDNSVLIPFVACIKLLLEYKIDEFLDMRESFWRSYFISDDVVPKPGGIDSTNVLTKNLKH